jgi:hypothetical protein
MGIGVCKRGFLFTLLTFLTIGISAVLFILVVYYFIDLGLQKAEPTIFGIAIAAMCASVLLLLYGLWASACGGKGVKYSLALVYLVYALGLLALGVSILALKERITDAVDDFFTREDPASQVRTTFERELGCKWAAAPGEEAVNCSKKVEDLYRSFGVGIAAGLIVLFAILLAGDVVAWRWLCSKWEDEEPAGAKPQTMTSPLTYSW